MNIPIREGVTTSAPSIAVETSDSSIPRKPILVEGGPAPEPITVTALTVTENGTYPAPEGSAYSPVTVNVPEKVLTTLNVTENGTYTPGTGFDGFSEVNVNVEAELPDYFLASEFDLLHSNSTVGFIDSVKKIKLATNKYSNFGDGFITGRSANVMMGYTNQGDVKRCVIQMGTFNRSVETQDRYQTLFKLISNNNHYTITWDNTNNRWSVSDSAGSPVYIPASELPKYAFDGALVEIVFGAKYINGQLVRKLILNNNVIADYTDELRVYINGELKIETNESFVGDTLNTIAEFRVGGTNTSWVGASFENVKIYTVLNVYEKYVEVEEETISNQSMASFNDGLSDVALRACTCFIEPIQSGSGNPSPSNVRPISGWTECNVTRDNKNLFDSELLLGASGWQKDSDGAYYGDNTNIYSYSSNNDIWKFHKDGYSYTFKCQTKCAEVGKELIFDFRYSDGTHTYGRVNATDTNWHELTMTSNSAKTIVEFVISYSSSGTCYIKNAQMEIGSTATTYEEYKGNTYNIEFPSEAGTVYGGTLDVTNGVLTVTDGYIASYNGETLPSTWISSMDVYAEGTTPTTGAEVVYKLAIPQTYDVTPTEVKTLLGINNIFADTGDISITYLKEVE